jgi:hypothetical protein
MKKTVETVRPGMRSSMIMEKISARDIVATGSSSSISA